MHGLPPDGFIAEPEAAASLTGAAGLTAAASVTKLDPRIVTEIKRAVLAALDERGVS